MKHRLEESDLFTSESFNDFHTNMLTDLGKALLANAVQIKDTMLLDVKEIQYNDQIITFQFIDRAMFGTPAPNTFEVTLRDA